MENKTLSYILLNGLGYQDFWQIQGVNSQFQPNSNIYIFDRYGKLLKQLNPLGNGWDGTFNGNDMPVGTYYYAIKLNDGVNNKPITGTITIIK